jgi:hypothetical protein
MERVLLILVASTFFSSLWFSFFGPMLPLARVLLGR